MLRINPEAPITVDAAVNAILIHDIGRYAMATMASDPRTFANGERFIDFATPGLEVYMIATWLQPEEKATPDQVMVTLPSQGAFGAGDAVLRMRAEQPITVERRPMALQTDLEYEVPGAPDNMPTDKLEPVRFVGIDWRVYDIEALRQDPNAEDDPAAADAFLEDYLGMGAKIERILDLTHTFFDAQVTPYNERARAIIARRQLELQRAVPDRNQ